MRRLLELVGLSAILIAAVASLYLVWNMRARSMPQVVDWEVSRGVTLHLVAPEPMTPEQFGAWCKEQIVQFQRGAKL